MRAKASDEPEKHSSLETLFSAALKRISAFNYVSAYIIELQKHIQQEEEVFFPRALASLNDDEWTIINEAIGELLAERINIEKARHVLKVESVLMDRYS